MLPVSRETLFVTLICALAIGSAMIPFLLSPDSTGFWHIDTRAQSSSEQSAPAAEPPHQNASSPQ